MNYHLLDCSRFEKKPGDLLHHLRVIILTTETVKVGRVALLRKVATEMARRQMGLEGEAQFVVLAEVLNLRLPILFHVDGLDDRIAESLNRDGRPDTRWTADRQI